MFKKERNCYWSYLRKVYVKHIYVEKKNTIYSAIDLFLRKAPDKRNCRQRVRSTHFPDTIATRVGTSVRSFSLIQGN